MAPVPVNIGGQEKNWSRLDKLSNNKREHAYPTDILIVSKRANPCIENEQPLFNFLLIISENQLFVCWHAFSGQSMFVTEIVIISFPLYV